MKMKSPNHILRKFSVLIKAVFLLVIGPSMISAIADISPLTVNWQREYGDNSAGIVIRGESPECWFSPTRYFVESPASVTLSDTESNTLGQVIGYKARGTGNSYSFETRVYGGVYNGLGQLTGFSEDRTYTESGNKYHIEITEITYDGLGNMSDGYTVVVTLIEGGNIPLYYGIWNGTLDSIYYPGGKVLDWVFNDDGTTLGGWSMSIGGGATASDKNASGTYPDPAKIPDASYTGRARENRYGTTSSYTLYLTDGVIINNTSTGKYKIYFGNSNWPSSDQGTFSVERVITDPPGQANNPIPDTAAADVGVRTSISWKAGTNAISHRIYFGTSPMPGSSEFMGGQTRLTFDPSPLEYNTTYYWRIDTVNAFGITIGEVWSFTTQERKQGHMNIMKCNVKAGKTVSSDSIQFSGTINATEADVLTADNIIIHLSGENMSVPMDWIFPVDNTTFKNGRLNSKQSNCSLILDTITGKISFSAKHADLMGLSCPLAVTVTIGGYAARVEADEAIVNGAKPCPAQLLMGVRNTMQVNKVQVKLGKTSGTDSVSVSGYFTIAGDYNKSNPMVITLGGQSFTVAGSQFSTKGASESCTNATCQEGPRIKAKFDFAKCTFQIQVAKANLSESGTVDFGINCFGHTLPEGTITLPQ